MKKQKHSSPKPGDGEAAGTPAPHTTHYTQLHGTLQTGRHYTPHTTPPKPGDGKAAAHRHHMRDAIAAVHNQTRRFAARVQRQNRLHRHEQRGHVVCLEKHLNEEQEKDEEEGGMHLYTLHTTHDTLHTLHTSHTSHHTPHTTTRHTANRTTRSSHHKQEGITHYTPHTNTTHYTLLHGTANRTTRSPHHKQEGITHS